MKIAIAFAVLAIALIVAGCSAFSPPNTMSADQLKQIAADKNASAVCSQVSGVWGTGRVVSVNVDKGSVQNGVVTVDANCTVSISNAATVKPHVEPAPLPSAPPVKP